ncbi:MAG TPA: hypothetical protein ACFYEF_11195, partial [Candidatus Wunengus sp. YC63]|uniref:hypothetical protein n=1 Tax=Candidatus Wunengus sp. YC63 TaxID=3367699 RepID=UPI004027672E
SSLFTGIAIAFVGYITSSSLERTKTNESHVQLYAELMGNREEAESALRKDMFNSIIGSFLNPQSISLEENMLNLELLVANFNESLNLKPLFIHLRKKIQELEPGDETGNKLKYMERLNKVAREITRKQLLVLEGAGKKFSKTIVLGRLKQDDKDKRRFYQDPEDPKEYYKSEEPLSLGETERIFRIVVLEADSKTKEIKVRLEVITPDDSNGGGDIEDTYIAAEFWVGFFDFPMIDNIRLSHDQRCSIILDNFYESSQLGNSTANITLIAFPGSHASLKEKPYYEEIVHNLLNTRKS